LSIIQPRRDEVRILAVDPPISDDLIDPMEELRMVHVRGGMEFIQGQGHIDCRSEKEDVAENDLQSRRTLLISAVYEHANG